ncbi:hypothetical protein ACO22_03788 [Paracoccidioides brasiliensis]|uniref:Uncharacterized protein n=1 Tax=Paracoccidioides brasiliensis TaxID=121759 RepID=A0A1D2JEZ5_PARBR|nr:hypothetical protein ACO22_03788 [Paracoccidioides brasiliensis]
MLTTHASGSVQKRNGRVGMAESYHLGRQKLTEHVKCQMLSIFQHAAEYNERI